MNQRDKAHFIDRVGREMDADLPAVKGSTPELLASCCRILASENHESGLAGQVTALTGLGRAIAGGPVGRAGALAYGVRHAVSLRRASRRTLPGRVMERGELARSEGKR